MKNLDDVAGMKQLDTVNVLGSVELLGGQSQQAWDEVHALSFPENYKTVSNIVFSGMGGSALGAYVTNIFADTLAIPFEIVNDYHLPPYVNEHTLVILSSYSGTTEETLALRAEEAVDKKAFITGITTGGALGKMLTDRGIPAYIFDPRTNNPSNQPRLGSGYSVVGLVALFDKLGFIHVDPRDVTEVVDVMNRGNSTYGASVATGANRAKQLGTAWSKKNPGDRRSSTSYASRTCDAQSAT